MLKEFVIRFLLVAVPSSGVFWAVAGMSGQLRTNAGLHHQLNMTLTLLAVTVVLFAAVYLVVRITDRDIAAPAPAHAASPSAALPADRPVLAERALHAESVRTTELARTTGSLSAVAWDDSGAPQPMAAAGMPAFSAARG